MDEGKYMYVYDDEYNHRGIFNGTKYRELDNDDQLLDQQFKLNPNPFGSKMMKEDPSLFISESGKHYFDYSKKCAWNQRIQPVVLTESEKKRIDRIAPNSYDDAIMYSTNPKDKKLWYICP